MTEQDRALALKRQRERENGSVDGDPRGRIGRCFDWGLRNTLKPMTRAEGIGLYIALVLIGVLFFTHFATEGHQRKVQSQAIERTARGVKVQAEIQAAASRRQSEAIVATNRQSQYDDCLQANNVRAGLRENVLRMQKTLPLFLHLLPQFDNAAVRRINRESVKRQLNDFAPRDCRAYAEEVVPPGEREKFSKVPLARGRG